MVKSANPWLRGLLRAGKQQRATARALTVLFAAPKPKPKPKSKPKAVRLTAAAPAAVTPRPKPKPAAISPVAVVPPGGKWLASHFSGRADDGHGALRRMAYWLYLPTTAPPAAGWPLVVMLHGCDQSATLFAQGTRMNQWAEKLGYAVLYPQQSVSAHPHRCWKWYDRATQQGGGDVSVIVGMVEKISGQYRFDRARIYICGLSAGAGMAHIVALNHPKLFAAVGLHSGPSYGAGHSTIGALGVMKHGDSYRVDRAIEEVLAQRPGFPGMPTMLVQGEDDDVVRPINQAHLTRQSMLLNRLPHGTAVDVTARAGNRTVNPHRVHDVYRDRTLVLRVAQVAKLAHAWSGGDASLSYNNGTGPDASKMLLDFFARHRRGG